MPLNVQSSDEASTRASIVQALRNAAEPLRVEDVAAAVGLKVSGTRWQLDRLVEAGAVRRTYVRAASRGRPAALYTAAPAADVDDVEPYRMLAHLLAAQLDAVTADGEGYAPARDAGAVWAQGRSEGGDLRGMVLKLLDDTGFRPRAGNDPRDIELGRCPYFDVASAHPQVVCRVHADLLRGALRQLGADPGAADLIPALTAERPCLVRLRDLGDG